MPKLFFWLTFALAIFLYFPGLVLATDNRPPAQVLVINQTRGEECCQPGSLDNLQQQLKIHQENQIPAYFVLRYDALNDSRYTKVIKEALNAPAGIIKVGALLEVLPSLARDAQVNFQADKDDWQEAQNAFTIGYRPEDRKKLVDQFFSRFHQEYGFYPQLSSSWMIDTPTANYLQQRYHVKAHLITREQWGTDTYHLYGGPPHYPYPASTAWIMIPDYAKPSPLFILRQAVTDPLRNYGDTSSGFTSQPNDYLTSNKTFAYFKDLLDQALFNQPGRTGFALLGLENSMESKYQDEFRQQLLYIKQLRQNGQITFPSIDDLNQTWKEAKLTVYAGRNLTDRNDAQAVWITSPRYRVRLFVVEGTLSITDLRVYHPELVDPYADYPAAKEGYWLTPYLIDASLNQQREAPKRSFWLKLFGPPPPAPSLTSPRNDLSALATRLTLTNKMTGGQINWGRQPNGEIFLTYPTNEGEVKIIFGEETIVFEGVEQGDFGYRSENPENHPIQFKSFPGGLALNWETENGPSQALDVNCQSKRCMMSFFIDPEKVVTARQTQYPFVFPERRPRPVDKEKTVIYVHNRYAVAGRNPVRLILIPKDKFGLPVLAEESISLETEPSVSVSNQTADGIDRFDQIIDLNAETPVSVVLRIKIGEELVKSERVFLAPNCKSRLIYCLTHPREALWYLGAVLHDKIRQKFFNEKQ